MHAFMQIQKKPSASQAQKENTVCQVAPVRMKMITPKQTETTLQCLSSSSPRGLSKPTSTGQWRPRH